MIIRRSLEEDLGSTATWPPMLQKRCTLDAYAVPKASLLQLVLSTLQAKERCIVNRLLFLNTEHNTHAFLTKVITSKQDYYQGSLPNK